MNSAPVTELGACALRLWEAAWPGGALVRAGHVTWLGEAGLESRPREPQSHHQCQGRGSRGAAERVPCPQPDPRLPPSALRGGSQSQWT